MNRLAVTFLALLAAAPAWAGKSHTSSVTQNAAEQSWTQKCTIRATGVSALNSYSGLLWIRYNDPAGENELVRREWAVGPGALTFAETSAGLYSINATLADKIITLTFTATRYGPLYAKRSDAGALVGRGGTFTCVGVIVNDLSGAVVHNIFSEEHIGAWQ